MSDQNMAGNTDDQNMSGQDPDMGGNASGMSENSGPGGMPSATEDDKASDKSGTESMGDDGMSSGTTTS